MCWRFKCVLCISISNGLNETKSAFYDRSTKHNRHHIDLRLYVCVMLTVQNWRWLWKRMTKFWYKMIKQWQWRYCSVRYMLYAFLHSAETSVETNVSFTQNLSSFYHFFFSSPLLSSFFMSTLHYILSISNARDICFVKVLQFTNLPCINRAFYFLSFILCGFCFKWFWIPQINCFMQ